MNSCGDSVQFAILTSNLPTSQRAKCVGKGSTHKTTYTPCNIPPMLLIMTGDGIVSSEHQMMFRWGSEVWSWHDLVITFIQVQGHWTRFRTCVWPCYTTFTQTHGHWPRFSACDFFQTRAEDYGRMQKINVILHFNCLLIQRPNALDITLGVLLTLIQDITIESWHGSDQGIYLKTVFQHVVSHAYVSTNALESKNISMYCTNWLCTRNVSLQSDPDDDEPAFITAALQLR